MAQGTLKIHTQNILPIIKQWLYSDKDVFVRELVSNSTDALRKLQILRDQGAINFSDDELKIELLINREGKTLQVLDSGLGMTSEEVEKYIAQIAFSGAEEFVSKYQGSGSEPIIGHFGLGFYSAYMVAKKVTIDTLSYLPNSKAAFWSCDGSSDYTIEEGTRPSRGTTITLHIDKENEEILDESKLRNILLLHCRFLPFPIFLNGTRINDKEPLWIKAPSECQEADYLDFYHTLYPLSSDPVFWIHLNVDVPFHLKGILYFPKLGRHFEWNQNNVQLYVNRVFVSGSCKDILPDFLLPLQGALDSPDIPINVSRSSLQVDRVVKQLSAHISKKVADKLSSLFHQEREKFLAFWPEIELIIKLGILQDDKFYAKAQEFLVWKTTQDRFLTLQEIQAECPEKVLYTSDLHTPLLKLYPSTPILHSTSPIDIHLFQLLESKLKLKFHRIDGSLDPALLDPSREKTLLDVEGKTESGHMSDFFRKALGSDHLTVEAKSLSSNDLPAILIVDEQSRRLRDAMAFRDPSSSLPLKTTFVVNTNSPLINSLYRLHEREPELAQTIAKHLHDLAQLGHKEFNASDLAHRSTQILEKLLGQISP